MLELLEIYQSLPAIGLDFLFQERFENLFEYDNKTENNECRKDRITILQLEDEFDKNCNEKY